jgi:23S rRNA pseudouridine2605 synthase
MTRETRPTLPATLSLMTTQPEDTASAMRLQRFLARAGVASRRASEEFIAAGRVSVNGSPVTVPGIKIRPSVDVVEVDGSRVTLPAKHAYFLLNKPAGVLTTMEDPHGRPTVAEFVPSGLSLFPVGRLDMDTTGALLVMSDGDLAHRLMHPSFHAEKTYMAEILGTPSEKALLELSDGVALDDGPTRPAQVSLVCQSPRSSKVRITLREGRKRQVKRMMEHIGHPVITLHRESFGPVSLGNLPEGEIRELAPAEVVALEDQVGLER